MSTTVDGVLLNVNINEMIKSTLKAYKDMEERGHLTLLSHGWIDNSTWVARTSRNGTEKKITLRSLSLL